MNSSTIVSRILYTSTHGQTKTVPVFEGSPEITTVRYMETYKNVSQDIRDQLNVEAEAVQIILTGIDNDIYSTVDACPNACEMWKEIERLKQVKSINVQDLETNLYWEFGKFTSRDGESLESYYSRFYKMMNELIRNQCDVTNHQVNVRFLLQLQPEWQRAETIARTANPLALVAQQQPVYHPQNHPTHYTQNSSTRSQQAATKNRGKAIFNSPPPIYDQEPFMVAEDDEMSKDKEIDKIMALISLSFKKIYKPTNNNLRTSSNTSRANQDNSPRINRGAGYDNQRLGHVVGARETVGITMVQNSGIQCYNCKEFGHVSRECQKPKKAKDAAYHREKMLLCKQQEAGIQLNVEQADWRDDTDDKFEDQELEAHYMYMAQIQELSPDAADFGPIFDTEPVQKIDQNDNDNDLANEREFLASLIEKLKCEIDDSKNRNKFLETSNKVLVEKLKGEIDDFKTKNKSLESSNNRFKEANNKLSETNKLMGNDLKKSQAELDRRNNVEYASKVEIDCAKAKGDLISYKMKSQKSFNKYTQTINDLNQTISEMKKELSAHQETISIMSQAKEAQIKLYKTHEDKELDKVIALENKVKVLDNIVYKTGQSVQKINMLNRNCKTSFARPEFIKKAQRANPRLYDIVCYKALQKHAINLEIDLQQCQEKITNDKSFKENHSKEFRKEREQYFEIQDLKAQLQDKGIAISELKKLIEKLKGKFVDTKFEKSLVIRQPNAFKSQRTSILGKPTIFSDSLERKDFSKSKPQLKSNPMEDRVLLNNSQGKKQEVEDHHRNVKFSKNKTSHDMCVLKSLDGVNSRTKMPIVVPVSTREPKRTVTQSVVKPLRKIVASKTINQKPRNTTTMLYEHLIEIFLFIVDSGCSKHMTGNIKLLINFVEKFLGTMKFRNDQIAPIIGYGDLVQGAISIKRVYYVKGLNHNLFSVGQFCAADLEVAFWKSTSTSSQAWLWHRRLSYLNFDTINLLLKNDIVIGLPKLNFIKYHLCSSCELGKAKRKSFQTKTTPSSKRRLQLLHIDLCGPMRVVSINGKRYVLVIIDDYSRYTWTHFLRSRDETPEVLIDFLGLVHRGLHAQVRIVRTNKGTEFLNKTLHAYFASKGILHQTYVARKPEQNGSRAYRVFNKRTRVIVETIHVNFDELPQMVSDHVSSDPVPQCQRTELEHDSLNPGPRYQENVPHSSAVTTADAPNHRQQQNTTPLNTQTTPEPTCHVPTQAPTVISTENINQAEMIEENAQVKNDEFINIFCTPVQDQGETSLQQVIRNPSRSVRTRRQLESDGEMCMFVLTQVDQIFRIASRRDLSGTPVDQTKYHSMVRALMYLIESRPDIMHATSYCARYQAKPTEKHLTAIKRILRYLKDTIHMGLWYPKDTSFELTGFLDSDHAGCLDSRKRTSGGIQFLSGDKLVSWSSKKQDCTSMSSAKAEYHFKKEKVEKGIVELFFVETEYHLADMFTKALPEERFKYLVRRLGMRCLTPEELKALANESARSLKH
uniref:Retrovirus-related Pol polyprotein from transposon TNT 1-94 n=1 Tax=Tanacetum cinerariifolium TaxID=118510 RepID=A0A699GGB6_TANCI|nr:hypothetical protein [Tanacetum cinerariifolium]